MSSMPWVICWLPHFFPHISGCTYSDFAGQKFWLLHTWDRLRRFLNMVTRVFLRCLSLYWLTRTCLSSTWTSFGVPAGGLGHPKLTFKAFVSVRAVPYSREVTGDGFLFYLNHFSIFLVDLLAFLAQGRKTANLVLDHILDHFLMFSRYIFKLFSQGRTRTSFLFLWRLWQSAGQQNSFCERLRK